jgi:cell division protein FtsW
MNLKGTKGVITPVLLLTGIGVLMVYSSTALLSIRQYGDGFHYLLNHLFTIIMGTMAMFMVSRLDYQYLMKASVFLLIFSFMLLLLVFIPHVGLSVNGARRWIRLWPTTFQPSELVKLSIVIFLAGYMSKNIYRMKDLKYGILVPVSIMVLFQSIILLQPDFGGMMNIGILTLGLLYLGGARLRYLISLILVALPAVYILIASSPYRWKRVIAFLDPWSDPFGSGFQLVQSFIALGRGNIFGAGIGNSKQKLFFLPEAHTDFIFSLIGEEMGLVGTMMVIGLFIWLITKGIHIAGKTEDHFGYYLSMGLTMMIGVQAIINIAVTTGLMPTKGLPLPFISYGGSALLVNMIAAGILINIAESNSKKELIIGHKRLR